MGGVMESTSATSCDKCEEPEVGKVNNHGFCRQHMEAVIEEALSPSDRPNAIQYFKRLLNGDDPL